MGGVLPLEIGRTVVELGGSPMDCSGPAVNFAVAVVPGLSLGLVLGGQDPFGLSHGLLRVGEAGGSFGAALGHDVQVGRRMIRCL